MARGLGLASKDLSTGVRELAGLKILEPLGIWTGMSPSEKGHGGRPLRVYGRASANSWGPTPESICTGWHPRQCAKGHGSALRVYGRAFVNL